MKIDTKGFSMLEFVLLGVVMAILVVLALPIFTQPTRSAKVSRDNTVNQIKTGINLYRANQEAQGLAVSYPSSLDSVAVNSPCSTEKPCFSHILPEPITDSRWIKVSNTQYNWSVKPGETPENSYTYNPQTGLFQ